MQYVRELEAWSLPGQLLDAEYGKKILQAKLLAKGIPQNVFLGISAIPDVIDCENLRLSIQAGELTEDSFREFCMSHDLPTNLQSEESSAKFLEFVRGRCLAWIHLPAGADSSLLRTIVKTLKDYGHIVIDPENMRPIK
jgi:hypothetical protein